MNASTFIVLCIFIAIFFLALFYILRNKKKGKCMSCDCSSCSYKMCKGSFVKEKNI
ncbi:MAG: FeoB-associated Cys-rich membrane protein [Acutalibacteraceae bacterium]